jgi:hypothetical protein
MNYELLEDEVVTRLQPFSTVGITIERLPQTESERKQVNPADARFTVIYAGSEYEGTNSTAQIVQNEKVFVQVLIESTFLRGPRGIYTLASVLKKALTGFRPQNLTRLQVSKHHTIGSPEAVKKDNMWQYQVIFQGTNLHVEDFTEDISVLVQKITYENGSDTFDVPFST